MWEDKSHVYVETAIPGMKMDDIEVIYEKGILWVKAEKRQEEKDSDQKFYRRASRSFSYRVALPSQIDESKSPEATYQDGILKIAFPKYAQSKPKKINIKKGNYS